MKPEKAVAKLNVDPKHEEALRDFGEWVGSLAVIFVDGAGLLDFSLISAARAHCQDTHQSSAPGGITFDAWKAQVAGVKEACPMTGQPLFMGKVQVRGVDLDWSPVDRDRRLVAAYAAEVEGANDVEEAIEELSSTTLRARWTRRQAAWHKLRDKAQPTPADRRLRAKIEERLIFQPREDDIDHLIRRTGVNQSGPAPDQARSYEPPEERSGPPLVYLSGDPRWVAEFRKYAAVYTDIQDPPIFRTIADADRSPGEHVESWRRNNAQAARIMVHFIEAGYSSGPVRALNPGAHHVPVIVSSCIWKIGAFQNASALPRSEEPISTMRSEDRGGAWVEVVSAIRRLAEQYR